MREEYTVRDIQKGSMREGCMIRDTWEGRMRGVGYTRGKYA